MRTHETHDDMHGGHAGNILAKNRRQPSEAALKRALTEFGEVIWGRLRPFRDYNHSASCPTSAKQVIGFVEHRSGSIGRCETDCLEMFLDSVSHIALVIQTHEADVHNLGGYVNTSTGHFAVSWTQKRNVEWGGPAKPNRSDGIPGRIRAALPKEVAPELLGWMLQDACRRAPVPAELWSYERFAANLRALRPRLSQDQAMDTVRLHLDVILAVTRSVAPGWDVAAFEVPRARRLEFFHGAPVSTSSTDEPGFDVADPSDELDEEQSAMAARLRIAFRERLLSLGADGALRAACLRLKPGMNLAELSANLVRETATGFLLEMVVSAVGIDPDTHRLCRKPDEREMRRMIEEGCGGTPGSSRRITDGFLRRVERQVQAMFAQNDS